MLISNLNTTIWLKLLKNSNKTILKCFSTSVKPVKLAFAAYENTTSSQQEAPFLILHGLLGSKQNWASLCKAYSQKCVPSRKIIALDLRNHGESIHIEEHTYSHLVEDIRRFILDNNLEKISLMGHSMGGRCAMLFALTYPEFLEKLVVVDISPISLSPQLMEMPVIFQIMQRVQMPNNVPLSQARSLVDNQLSESISDKDLRAFILTNLVASDDKSYKWRVNISTLIKAFGGLVQFPEVDSVQYTGKTLFIGGEDSNFIPRSDYPKILKLFPNAELKYIQGAGHWVHAEKPNEFLKMTLDFLNKKTTSVS